MTESIRSMRYPLAVDEALGRVREENDYAAHVEQLIMQVLLTSPGERVHRPDFGCGLRRMVFAPNSDVNASLVQITVFQALDRWLSSVIKVEAVEATAIDSTLEVQVTYTLKARQQRRILNLAVNA